MIKATDFIHPEDASCIEAAGKYSRIPDPSEKIDVNGIGTTAIWR